MLPVARRRPGCARRRSREEHSQLVTSVERPAPSPSCSRSRVVVGTGGAAPAHGRPPAPAPTPVTRAALDPALVAGRGANVGFLEQEAEKAATNGTVIGPDRTAYTLPAEASGRSAVKLTPGQYVEFTLPKAANALTVRYAIPDAPTGGGITAPLDVTVNGAGKRTMTLTSQYSWLYNQYPFTQRPERRPAAPRLVDHRVRLRARGDDADADDHDAVPAHALLRRAAPAARQDVQGRRQGPPDGARRHATPRGPSSTCSTPSWSALPHVRLKAANVLLFGADPFGPAGLRRRVRQGDRVRARRRTCRSTCRRASTR